MSSYKTFGAGTYSLGASCGSTDTTLLLTSFTEPVSGTPYTMALLATDIVYATIAPGTSSSEFISFSGITQNLDGTATLTGVVRGLAKKYPFTTSATFKLPHSSQTTFIISNPPQLYEKFVSIENTETIAGVKTFSSFPITPSSAPTTDYQTANKKYVDDAVIAGAVKATNLVYGISKLSVAAASAADPIVVGTNDNRVSPVSLATITADIVAALAGTGTPNGTTGKYVTYDSTGETGTTKIIRTKSTGKLDTSIIDTGTTAGQVIISDTGNKLPVIDGSQLTNLPVPSYVGALTTVTPSTTTNTDTTFTCGFQPTTIVIRYTLQGTDNGTARYSSGTAVYSGSTLVSVHNLFTNIIAGNVTTSTIVLNATAPTAGTANGNAMAVTLSVLSVSATNFIVRVASVLTGSGQTGSVIFSAVAFR